MYVPKFKTQRDKRLSDQPQYLIAGLAPPGQLQAPQPTGSVSLPMTPEVDELAAAESGEDSGHPLAIAVDTSPQSPRSGSEEPNECVVLLTDRSDDDQSALKPSMSQKGRPKLHRQDNTNV